ncbi:hypothetical protein HYW76_00535 [Candidatus Pacearchaeota archaeon]|nr:hypothetical protein [Candidatus Pacearchaeota archaeon]
MKKEENKNSGKRKWGKIIVIALVVLLILAVIGYFILTKTNKFSFGFAGFDFSSSAKALNIIGDAANKNNFENVKLNPFVNVTG